MVEVFKTNVQSGEEASFLISMIDRTGEGYTANFDLDDCDKILRIVSGSSAVNVCMIIEIMRDLGYYAEVLPDEENNFTKSSLINRRSFSN
jgi:hypothetical protein